MMPMPTAGTWFSASHASMRCRSSRSGCARSCAAAAMDTSNIVSRDLVAIADHPRHLPLPFFLLPDVDELERAAFLMTVLVVAEAMRADFDGAVVTDRVDLETPEDELAADAVVLIEIALESRGQIAVAEETAGVVVELDLV